MNRQTKILFTILVILIGGLASVSGFFIAKTTTLEGKLNSDTSQDTKATTAATAPATTVTTPAATTPVTSPTPSTSTTTTTPATTTTTTPPVAGTAGTYTVQAGDTMSSIAAKLKINWLDLATANGLDANTANKIKIGQVLILPK